jgi:20S proteasome alpha/beta subunit
MDMDDAADLSMEALQQAVEGEPTSKTVEIGVVKKDEKFRKLSFEDVQKYLNNVKKKR